MAKNEKGPQEKGRSSISGKTFIYLCGHFRKRDTMTEDKAEVREDEGVGRKAWRSKTYGSKQLTYWSKPNRALQKEPRK